MTWKISIELDCTHTQAQTVYDDIANWAHEGHPIELPDVTRWSPAVSLEPHHPDDDDLHEAASLLRRLGFDTAAEAVQAARRNLTPTDPPNVTRLVTEQCLAARRRVASHQARGGRIL